MGLLRPPEADSQWQFSDSLKGKGWGGGKHFTKLQMFADTRINRKKLLEQHYFSDRNLWVALRIVRSSSSSPGDLSAVVEGRMPAGQERLQAIDFAIHPVLDILPNQALENSFLLGNLAFIKCELKKSLKTILYKNCHSEGEARRIPWKNALCMRFFASLRMTKALSSLVIPAKAGIQSAINAVMISGSRVHAYQQAGKSGMIKILNQITALYYRPRFSKKSVKLAAKVLLYDTHPVILGFIKPTWPIKKPSLEIKPLLVILTSRLKAVRKNLVFKSLSKGRDPSLTLRMTVFAQSLRMTSEKLGRQLIHTLSPHLHSAKEQFIKFIGLSLAISYEQTVVAKIIARIIFERTKIQIFFLTKLLFYCLKLLDEKLAEYLKISLQNGNIQKPKNHKNFTYFYR